MKTGWQMEWEREMAYDAPVRARINAIRTALDPVLITLRKSFSLMTANAAPALKSIRQFEEALQKMGDQRAHHERKKLRSLQKGPRGRGI